MPRTNTRKTPPERSKTKMATRTWNVTHPQAEFLARKAQQLGVNVAELVRRIIDEYRAREERDRPAA